MTELNTDCWEDKLVIPMKSALRRYRKMRQTHRANAFLVVANSRSTQAKLLAR